jgi:ABC-2 type transport system ATP-binding protein
LELSVERLAVGYGSRLVLSELDLVLSGGTVHGLVGRNGAGKTTLLETLAGFLRPRSGSVTLDGRAPTRRDVGYLPMETYFYPRITGREYLGLFRGERARFDADAWASLFDLPLDAFVDGYSAGMAKKLALIGVLSLGRPVLLLDEPANGLDLESNLVLGALLRELASAGHAVLVTSHVLESLTAVCDEIHLLEGGRVAHRATRSDFHALATRLLTAESEAKLARMRSLVAVEAPS